MLGMQDLKLCHNCSPQLKETLASRAVLSGIDEPKDRNTTPLLL